MPANPPPRIHLRRGEKPEPGWAWCGQQLIYVQGRWRDADKVAGVTCLQCLRRLGAYHRDMMIWAGGLEAHERARRGPVK